MGMTMSTVVECGECELMNQPMGYLACSLDGNYIEVAINNVTPLNAKHILDKHNSRNRSLVPSTISLAASDMQQGFWCFNGAPLIFDLNGELMDGQNRLTAQIRAGTTETYLIVGGLDPDAMETIDQIKARTVKDILETTGSRNIPNVTQVISTASILMAGDRALYRSSKDKKKVAKYVRNSSDSLFDLVSWAKGVSDKSPKVDMPAYSDNRRCLSASPLAALAQIMIMNSTNNQGDLVIKFFEKISSGIVSSESERISVQTIRSWLTRSFPLIREGGTQFPRMMKIYATLINAYNRMQSGDTIRLVKLYSQDVRFFDELPAVQ